MGSTSARCHVEPEQTTYNVEEEERIMPKYTASRGSVGAGVTTATATDLLIIEAGTSRMAKIWEVGWGGEAIATTAMRTRFTLATTAGTAITGTVDTQKGQPATDPTQAATLGVSSTSPTYAAGSMVPIMSWNAHGGVVRWLAAPGEEFVLIQVVTTAKQAALRNEVGATTITCGLVFEE
jgi:hypothetical protein